MPDNGSSAFPFGVINTTESTSPRPKALANANSASTTVAASGRKDTPRTGRSREVTGLRCPKVVAPLYGDGAVAGRQFKQGGLGERPGHDALFDDGGQPEGAGDHVSQGRDYRVAPGHCEYLPDRDRRERGRGLQRVFDEPAVVFDDVGSRLGNRLGRAGGRLRGPGCCGATGMPGVAKALLRNTGSTLLIFSIRWACEA